jgi:hypothetical protein
MAFQTSISATQFSHVMASRETVPAGLETMSLTAAEAALKAIFDGTASGEYLELPDIRDMPSFGTPANLVKVPVYGQAQTQTIGAQSDAPDLEFTINYVPSKWVKSGTDFSLTGGIGDAVGDGLVKVFQVALLGAKPDGLHTTTTGLGTVPNTLIYFVGKIESILINPSRDDATTATVALSIVSDFYGPFTQNDA